MVGDAPLLYFEHNVIFMIEWACIGSAYEAVETVIWTHGGSSPLKPTKFAPVVQRISIRRFER